MGMDLELFGARLAPEFLIVAIPAFIVIGNHSVYPSQRVRLQKSPFVPILTGQGVDDAEDGPLPAPWTRTNPNQQNPPTRDQESHRLRMGAPHVCDQYNSLNGNNCNAKDF